MAIMRRINSAKAIVLVLVFGAWTNTINASPVLTTLNIATSSRAAGMGDCAINLVDEESSICNPGILGLFHMQKRIGFFWPIKSSRLPEVAKGLSFHTFGLSLGRSFEIDSGNNNSKKFFAAAIAYSRFKLDWGLQTIYDEVRHELKNAWPYDKSDNFSIALGLDCNVKIGLGLTYKMAEEHYSYLTEGYGIKGNAVDFGFIAEIPILRIIAGNEYKSQGVNGILFDLTPSIAYVNANNGANPKIDGRSSQYSLPHIGKLGFSILGTASNSADQYASLRISWEKQNDLVSKGNDISRIGMEFGFWEFLFLRTGNIDHRGAPSFTTIGAGLDLGVLLSRYYIRRHMATDAGWYSGPLRNINLKLNYSHYNEVDDSPFANMEYINFGFSF
jgi:hypothetical protein